MRWHNEEVGLTSCYHVWPIDDLREHVAAIDCWCKPRPDEVEPLVWVHHSMDRREEFETGERLPS